MRDRLRAVVHFDNLIPAGIAAVALFVMLEPRFFGVQIADRQIILLLFGFLALDSVVERSGRLCRMEKKLVVIERHMTGRIKVAAVLRTRVTFERVDALIKDARRQVLIIGINLEAAVVALPTIVDLARSGVEVTLLAMDPDGSSLAAGARMSGVVEEIRRQKIRQNLDLIKGEMMAMLSTSQRRKCGLMVVDRILPVGAIGVDVDSRRGVLIAQHYLTSTPAERAPILELRRDVDPEWYDLYLGQCIACKDGARAW